MGNDTAQMTLIALYFTFIFASSSSVGLIPRILLSLVGALTLASVTFSVIGNLTHSIGELPLLFMGLAAVIAFIAARYGRQIRDWMNHRNSPPPGPFG